MKDLKYITESSNVPVSLEELKDFFWDIEENGWVVRPLFRERLFRASEMTDILTLRKMPLMYVRIFKSYNQDQRFDYSKFKRVQDLENLKKSDLYKQTIEVVSNRLKDFGLFISSDEIDSSTFQGSDLVVELIIIIAREEDKEFIKSGILP
jgi:hypothetical protein